MAAIWDNRDPDLNGTRLIVLLCLADHANDDGECWPSLERLANRARVTRRNVIEHLKALRRLGYIDIIHNPGKKNRYRVRAARHPTGDAGVTRDATITRDAGITPTRDASITPTRDAGITTPVILASPESSVNHQSQAPSKPPEKQQHQHARVSKNAPSASRAAAAAELTPEQELALECLLIAAPQFHNPRSFVLQHEAKAIAHWATYVASPKTEYEIRNPAAFIRAGVAKGEAAPLAANFNSWWYNKLAQRSASSPLFTEQALEY